MQQLAEAVAAGLRDTGCLIVADPRVACMDNDRFLDMMERYFDRPTKDKLVDSRPELHYQVEIIIYFCCLHLGHAQCTHKTYSKPYMQVGVTPEGTEVPRCVRDPDSLASISQQVQTSTQLCCAGPFEEIFRFCTFKSRG